VNERLRAVALGLGVGLAPLLLLDLGGTLATAVARDATETSVWWPVASYLAAGAVAAVGIGLARRDRLLAVVAALVVILVALPLVPASGTRWLAELPIPALGDRAGLASLFVISGAYAYVAIRGPQA
jgi:hypothetical protein